MKAGFLSRRSGGYLDLMAFVICPFLLLTERFLEGFAKGFVLPGFKIFLDRRIFLAQIPAPIAGAIVPGGLTAETGGPDCYPFILDIISGKSVVHPVLDHDLFYLFN